MIPIGADLIILRSQLSWGTARSEGYFRLVARMTAQSSLPTTAFSVAAGAWDTKRHKSSATDTRDSFDFKHLAITVLVMKQNATAPYDFQSQTDNTGVFRADNTLSYTQGCCVCLHSTTSRALWFVPRYYSHHRRKDSAKLNGAKRVHGWLCRTG